MRPESKLPTLGLMIFSFLLAAAHAASTYRVLHNFGATGDGTLPYGPLVVDSKGNLYGVTTDGGTGACSDYGCGTVFELERGGNEIWTEKVLYSFTAGSDGAFPDGNLLLDSAGNIFGTVHGDLSFAVSGVFQLTPGIGGWTNTIIYDYYSGPGLVSDKFGNLYGDIDNGSNEYGMIGELSPGSGGWTYAALAEFSNNLGYGPPAPPIWDDKGNLFGATYEGGIGQPVCWNRFGCGVAFEMTPNSNGTWDYHVLHVFASATPPHDGQSPSGGLAMDSSGNLYGVTVYGGVYKNGRVFRLSPVASGGNEWAETALYDFPYCAEGCLPGGSLVFDQAGNLYGVASGGKVDCAGGTLTCGVVFKLSPQANGSWSYSVVHRFTGKDGNFPVGVSVDDHGNLFGVTSNGGTYNTGVAFEIIP